MWTKDTEVLAMEAKEMVSGGVSESVVAEHYEISAATLKTWLIWADKKAEPEDTNSQRALEIARADRWNFRLEAVWDTVPEEQRAEYIHKFISSFDRLSKARRGLGGLDRPARTDITFTASTLQTPEEELQQLAKELGF